MAFSIEIALQLTMFKIVKGYAIFSQYSLCPSEVLTFISISISISQIHWAYIKRGCIYCTGDSKVRISVGNVLKTFSIGMSIVLNNTQFLYVYAVESNVETRIKTNEIKVWSFVDFTFLTLVFR